MRFLKMFFFSLFLFSSAFSQKVETVTCYDFTSTIPLAWEINSLNNGLSDWSQNRSFSEHFKITAFDNSIQLGADSLPVAIRSSGANNLIAWGSLDLIDNKEMMTLFFYDVQQRRLFHKRIPLPGREKEELMDIVCMKIHALMQEVWLGTLEIKTIPVETSVRINGFLAGATPLELTLARGTYQIHLEKEYFEPLDDKVEIKPGVRQLKEYHLQFTGFNTRPYLYAALGLSILTIGSKIHENSLHNQYQNMAQGLPKSEYDRKFDDYKKFNYLTLISLNVSTVFYGIAIYGVIKNRELRKNLIK